MPFAIPSARVLYSTVSIAIRKGGTATSKEAACRIYYTMDAKELFMNGQFVPAEQGVISVRTHGFAYGTGCFEGIRGYWNEEDQQVYLFRLREHFQRLLLSCKILQIELPYTVDQLIEISIEIG